MTHFIFDLDGTLFDTEFEVSRITAEIAQQHGCNIDAVEVFNKFSGYGSIEKFTRIAETCSQHFSDELLKELQKEHTSRKESLYDQPSIPVIPYVPEMLEVLQKQGHILSIGSSNNTDRIKKGLNKTGLAHYFNDRVYGPDLTQGVKKPDPAVFLHAMKENRSSPDDTIIVEDTTPGIVAGHAAGAKVIAYLDPRFDTGSNANQKKKEFSESGANEIIRNYQNFVKLCP